MIRNPRVRQPLAALLLGLTLGGCQSWRVVPGNPSQAIAQFPRHAIRVQLRDGEVLVLDAPKVVDDSIRGLVHYAPGDSSAPVVVALSDVRRLETMDVNRGKTFLTLGIALSISLIIAGSCQAKCPP